MLALLCGATFLETFAGSATSAFTPLYLERELGVARSNVPAWAGAIAGGGLLLAVPLAPFWGVLADRYGRKWLIARALLSEAIGYGIGALAQDPYVLLLGRMIMGLSYGSIALMTATQVVATPTARRGFASGAIQMGALAGVAIGPLVGGLVAATLGPRAMFVIGSLLCGLGLAAFIVLFRDPVERTSGGPGVRERLGILVSIGRRDPMVRWTLITFFFFSAGFGAGEPYLPILVQQVYDGPDVAQTVGVVLTAHGLVAAACALGAGRAADRWGPAGLALTSMLLLAAASLGLAGAGGLGVVVALLLVRGAAYGGSNTLMYSLIVRSSPPDALGAVVSLMVIPRTTGLLLGPLFASALSTLGIGTVFLGCAAIVTAAAGGCAALMAGDPTRRAAERPPCGESPGRAP